MDRPRHETSRWIWLEQFAQDAVYGWRTLRHHPAFAATAIVTLAVGLALTTGLFTVFNAYVLRSFAVRDPATLYQVVWHARDAAGRNLRWRDYEALGDRRDLFSGALAASTRYVSHHGRPLAAELVSPTYFEVLRPDMAAGRPLGPADERSHAVVIADQTWQALFGRDPAAIGREIDVNGRRFVIVGVLGPRFAGLHAMPRDIWIPAFTYAAEAAPELMNPDARPFDVTVRLNPGITPAQAQAAVASIVVEGIGRDQKDPLERRLETWAELRRQDRPTPLSIRLLALLSPVFAAFALVLVAGCANVSSVMLARAVAREREMALRVSLGARRGRIVRQLLTEGLLVALMASAVSLVLTFGGLRAATAIFFSTLPPSLAAILRTAPLAIDHRVYGFALLVAAASTLAFALVPALQASRSSLVAGIGAHGSQARRGSRLRAALVASQVAISLLLVVPALTLARNGAAVQGADVGFDLADVVSINVREGNEVALVERVARVMEAEPRAASVAVSSGNPLFGPGRRAIVEAERTRIAVPCQYVSPAYFETLRIPLVRGRSFRGGEAASEAPVAIVSAALARTLWPGREAIGRTLRIDASSADAGGPAEATVVGVAGDIISGLVVDGAEPGHLYLPTAPGRAHARALVVRGRGRQALAAEPLHDVLRRAVADPQVLESLPLEEVRTLQVYPFVAASWVGSALGMIALALSISGLFGVLTYALTQRTREIGIRMALGASGAAVVRMVLGQTAALTGVGAAVGLAGAFALLQALAAVVRLRAVSWLDLRAFAGGLALVAAAAIVAAWHPARRASRVDPAEVLRAD